ncbi:DUF1775 domain-containing protein [Actinoplanes friuliensis]|uniref:DUF1775 domain-containing protein n=1 Tax=Actinoplanes friuliensis TaxID=196914 RepID=UPI0003FC2402|nr:DUF1775 domain-containing protein [Actinoplanes friuliensis]
MRHLEKHRRAGVLAAAVATGVLCAASPAAADVTVSPPTAPQGSGTNVTFRVTNTAQSAITRVKLVLPADQPVAEVYPLSVDNWAPQIVQRDLDKPLTSIHGGQPVTETASAIVWIAMPGKSLAPGKSADLAVALGPLPVETTQMSFAVEPTYADPAKGAAMPPAQLALTPAVPGQEGAAHGGHSGTGTSGTSDADAALFAALLDENDGPGFWTIAGWVVAALAAAAGVIAVLRSRRRNEPAASDDSSEDPPKELVGAAPRVTSWSYKDGPAE